MRNLLVPVTILLAGILLAACGGTPETPAALLGEPTTEEIQPAPTESDEEIVTEAEDKSGDNNWPEGQTREDAQGAVTVLITPHNLYSGGETLDFEVALDTHSVDLGMDLAFLSTLTTDTGKTVQALRWDAPLGGHHVSGVLSFPASQDGALVLEGATELTLAIRDVDAPERIFRWQQ
jgi:hypothetical protein